MLKDMGHTDYNTAFMYAAQAGQLAAMKLLMEWGASDYDGALAGAASFGKLETMEFLKDLGATDYEYALNCAYEDDQPAAAELLETWINNY